MPKKLSRQGVVRKLDRLISQIIRYKNADEDGNITCISCNKKIHRKKAHCCHWIDRGRFRYRFSYDNLAPGCAGCNTYRKEFHIRVFTLKQIERLGIDKVQEMQEQSEIDKNMTYKISTYELRDLLEKVEQEHKELFSS